MAVALGLTDGVGAALVAFVAEGVTEMLGAGVDTLGDGVLTVVVTDGVGVMTIGGVVGRVPTGW